MEITDNHIKEVFKDCKNNTAIGLKLKRLPIELLEYIRNRFGDSKCDSESLYRILYNIKEKPKCPVCGKPAKYYIAGKYRDTCGDKKCVLKLNKTNLTIIINSKSKIDKQKIEEKRRQTCFKKYGVENYYESNEFKEKSKCTCLRKYGVENPSQSDIIKAKRKNTCIERYGTEYACQSEKVKNKIKETFKKHYNVECSLQSNYVREKSKCTCIERYGTEYACQSEKVKNKIKETYLKNYTQKHKTTNIKKSNNIKCKAKDIIQSQIIKDKIKQTCLKKYGVEYFWQSKEIIKKRKQTLLRKYGVDSPLKSKEIQNKLRHTCLEKYGVNYSLQSDKVKEKSKQTSLKKYGVENPVTSEIIKQKIKESIFKRFGETSWAKANRIKVKEIANSPATRKKYKQTCLDKYGVDHPFKVKEIKERHDYKSALEKSLDTKRKNGTFNTSKPEQECLRLLLDKFPETKYQYKSIEYPFECDFYVPEIDTYIEYNGFMTHGGHPFNPDDENDIKTLDAWSSKQHDHPLYKNAIDTWTRRDVEKRNVAMQNNLNYLVFFNIKQFLEWYMTQ